MGQVGRISGLVYSSKRTSGVDPSWFLSLLFVRYTTELLKYVDVKGKID